MPNKCPFKCSSKCSSKCDKKICIDRKKLSKRNALVRNICKAQVIVSDIFPACATTGCTFYHQSENQLYIFDGDDWIPMCGNINVETSNSQDGPPISGPISLNTCGDTLRLWSTGGLFTNVQSGSALIQVEPNIIFIGDDPDEFVPADPTRPAIYFDETTNNSFLWNPNIGGNQSNWTSMSSTPVEKEKISVVLIDETESGNNVVINHPIFLNPTGIGRFSLESEIIFPDTQTIGIIKPGAFVPIFETVGPNIISLKENHLVIPSSDSYKNKCLPFSKMYLEIYVNVTFEAQKFGSTGDTIILQLIKNGIESIGQSIFRPDDNIDYHTLQLKTISEFVPGDTIDIYMIKNSKGATGIVTLIPGKDTTYATYHVLGFEEIIV